MRLVRIVTPSVIATLAACGGPRAAQPAVSVQVDSGAAVNFKSISAAVKNVDGAQPPCPVTPHFEAVLTVSKMSGTLRYRWERSTGVNGPVQELRMPLAARTNPIDVPVKADEWPVVDRGHQLTLTDRLHVLSPLNALSPPLSVDAKCY